MKIINYIKGEINVIKEKDPSIKTNLEVFLYPSFRAIIYYRISHFLYLKKHYFLARYISEKAKRKTGIEIHPGAQIGKGLFIDHGNGVVIGETAKVGNNVTIYHGVTLGATGKDTGKRHPTVEDNVMIGAGAKILGPIIIGKNTKVGAGAVVLSSSPENSTIVGVPSRVAKISQNNIDNILEILKYYN